MAYTPFSSSVVTFQNDPTKLVGTMSVVGGTVGTSVIGLTPVGLNVGGNPVTTSNPVAVQPPASGFIPVSILGGTVGVSNFPTTQNISGSVAATGSITALQGTNPWVIGNSSVTVLNAIPPHSVSGVGTFQVFGSTSIVGVPQPHSVSGVGIFNTNNIGNGSVITVAQGSVAATVINIPQASIHGTVKVFPASIVTGTGSVNGAASVAVLSAPGAGLRNYITDIIISNTGAATTLVSITDGDASVIGKTIAPAGGGSNIIGLTSPMIPSQNQVVNIVAATATSVLHAWLGGYKAP